MKHHIEIGDNLRRVMLDAYSKARSPTYGGVPNLAEIFDKIIGASQQEKLNRAREILSKWVSTDTYNLSGKELDLLRETKEFLNE